MCYLGNDMQNITAHKLQASLLARNVRIVFRMIVEVGANANLALAQTAFGVGGQQLEIDSALRVLLVAKYIYI